MSRRARLVVALPVLVAAGAAGAYWWHARSENAVPDRLTLYGNVEIRDARLAFNEQERVAEILVEEGQLVEPGQVLARLERDRLEAQLAEAEAMVSAQREVLRRLRAGTRALEIEQAEARLAAAEARARNAERLVLRLKNTSRVGASTEQDLDDARAALEVARAEVNERREALELAREGPREEEIAEARAVLAAREAKAALLEERLEDTVLRAPARGVIQSRILEPGELASPAQPAIVLALTERKWVRAYLPEPELGRVNRGMKARVHSDSFPGRAFEGWIGFISPQAEFTPKSVQTTDLRTQLVYETRIWVEDPGDELRLGMPVTVELDARPAASERAASRSGRRGSPEPGG